MSTITEAPARGDQSARREPVRSLDRLLAWRPALTWETAFYGALFLLALCLRFWHLSDRAMHHDESLHAVYSWYLYDGRGYEHHPLMHGPLLFHLMAAVYFILGVSDTTARFVPALWGAAMVLLPLLLRPWLGRVGTLAAAAFIALSPSLLYFSRFVGAGAQDILVLVGMLLVVAGAWRFVATDDGRWLYLLAGGLAIGFTTKEVTYMQAALLVLFFNGKVAAHFADQWARPRTAWDESGYDGDDDLAGDLSEEGEDEETEVDHRALSTNALRGDEDADGPVYAVSDVRRRLQAALFFPIAWALVLFWPSLGTLRRRWGLRDLPLWAGPLVLVGTLSAPFFAAAAEIPLANLGIHMDNPSAFTRWTNAQFWGAVTIAGLFALAGYFGTGWRRREWLIAAAIFWGINIVLYTTFFTNPKGVATGIWGSLDYWLEQQGERRGLQPVHYYAVLTPVYEFLTLTLGIGLVSWRALRTGRDTSLALALAVVALLGAAYLGDGAHASLPFALVAVVAFVYSLRGDSFLQFLAFWFVAIFLGLSVAGEKMPWLETYIALPLALIAALAVNEAVTAAQRVAWPVWVRPVALWAAFGATAAALTLASDRFSWALPVLFALIVVVAVASLYLQWRGRAGIGLAAAVFVLAFFGPLSVRAAVVAAYEHGDTPVEMLVYTQSSPAQKRIADEIYAYAKFSGLGYETPITVDATQAFAWPWVWYLRDFKRVNYPEMGTWLNNPQLIASLQPNSVLLAELSNSGIGNQRQDIFGPGQRYEHRWWFPEGNDPRGEYPGDGYRGLTAKNLAKWVRDPEHWKAWGNYWLHRDPGERLGSIDAVAFFPKAWAEQRGEEALAQTPVEPRTESDGRIVAGGSGFARGQFQRPAGLAVDAQGNVYVADSRNNRVQKLGPDGRALATLVSPGGFNEPWGVAIDSAGNVYVADTWNHRIQKFDSDLRFERAWGGPPARSGPEASPTPLELYGPRDIAVDRDGNVWVTDTGHHRLVKYSANGDPMGVFGGQGTGPGQFSEPVAVAFGPDGTIAVTDTWNNRVQLFDPAFTFKSDIKVEGWQDRGTETKPYLAFDSVGVLYVSVPDASWVLRFGPDGKALSPLTLSADATARPNPLGVAADPRGRLWVADGGGNTVQGLNIRP